MIIKAFKSWLNRRAVKRDERQKEQMQEFNRLSAKLVRNQVEREIMIQCGQKPGCYAMHVNSLNGQELALDMLFRAQVIYCSQETAKEIVKYELRSVIAKVESEIGRPITDKAEVMQMLEAL